MIPDIEVLVTLPFTEEQLARLSSLYSRVRITQLRTRHAEEVPAEVWQRTEVLYTNRVLPTPEQAPVLRWIQFHWAGIDHALNAPILMKPGVIATSLSGASATQVAEYVVMMLLSLGHRLPSLMAHQRAGDWPKERWERFSPRELRDATVGIIGYGSIGRQVARLLHPFGAHILATKRDAMHPQDEGYTPTGFGDPEGDYLQRLYPAVAIKSMVKECDFLVITVPLCEGTRNLVDAGIIEAMKPNTFIVDVSRGGVVDHEALVEALRSNRIAGAALDVYPEEPLPGGSLLWKLNNVILTPHISGNSPYYDDRAITLFEKNLASYLAGKPLFNCIDLARGY